LPAYGAIQAHVIGLDPHQRHRGSGGYFSVFKAGVHQGPKCVLVCSASLTMTSFEKSEGPLQADLAAACSKTDCCLHRTNAGQPCWPPAPLDVGVGGSNIFRRGVRFKSLNDWTAVFGGDGFPPGLETPWASSEGCVGPAPWMAR
jgi:hypothetical protein